MKRFFSTASFVIPILFVPLTVLILFSQNTVPGNLLYPYKRGLEVIILAAASLNPTTGAYFHTNLSDRRYAEAESMLLAKNDISGLSTFVDEVTVTQLAITEISDPKKQQELNAVLIAQIDAYQSGLTKVQTQVNEPTVIPSPSPTIFQKTPQLTKEQDVPTVTSVIIMQPTNTPTVVAPQVVPPPPPSSAPVSVAIDRTQERLEKIKEEVRQRGERKDDKSEEKKSEEKKSRVDKRGN